MDTCPVLLVSAYTTPETLSVVCTGRIKWPSNVHHWYATILAAGLHVRLPQWLWRVINKFRRHRYVLFWRFTENDSPQRRFILVLDSAAPWLRGELVSCETVPPGGAAPLLQNPARSRISTPFYPISPTFPQHYHGRTPLYSAVGARILVSL